MSQSDGIRSEEPRGLLHLLSDLDPAMDDVFAAWCDVHHRENLAIPGVLRARRYRRADDQPGVGRLLTMYDLADVTVLDTPAFVGHTAHGTPMPAGIGASLSFERTIATLAGELGDTSGTELLVRSLVTDVGSTPDQLTGTVLEAVGSLVASGTVLGARAFTSIDEERPGVIVLMECHPDGADGPPGDWSLAATVAYRLVFDERSG